MFPSMRSLIETSQCSALIEWMRPALFWGYTVARLVEALHYKPEGHGFDSR